MSRKVFCLVRIAFQAIGFILSSCKHVLNDSFKYKLDAIIDREK